MGRKMKIIVFHHYFPRPFLFQLPSGPFSPIFLFRLLPKSSSPYSSTYLSSLFLFLYSSYSSFNFRPLLLLLLLFLSLTNHTKSAFAQPLTSQLMKLFLSTSQFYRSRSEKRWFASRGWFQGNIPSPQPPQSDKREGEEREEGRRRWEGRRR